MRAIFRDFTPGQVTNQAEPYRHSWQTIILLLILYPSTRIPLIYAHLPTRFASHPLNAGHQPAASRCCLQLAIHA